MKTSKEIRAALTAYRPDQLSVIHGMAEQRGLDPKALTPSQYRSLIVDEAKFSYSVDARSDDRAERDAAEKYHDDLLRLAGRIIS